MYFVRRNGFVIISTVEQPTNQPHLGSRSTPGAIISLPFSTFFGHVDATEIFREIARDTYTTKNGAWLGDEKV